MPNIYDSNWKMEIILSIIYFKLYIRCDIVTTFIITLQIYSSIAVKLDININPCIRKIKPMIKSLHARFWYIICDQ